MQKAVRCGSVILRFGFTGGIRLDDNKDRTSASPIESMPASAEVIIHMSQHSGSACVPSVSQGEYVYMGQPVGDSSSPAALPVHSSVSGYVKSVSQQWHPCGIRKTAVVIENDFMDSAYPGFEPFTGELDDLSPADIISLSRMYGIAGMGGEGVPLHTKLKEAFEKNVELIIINGTECEPLVTSDHRAMVEYPRYIVNGIRLIMNCLGKRDAVIAILDNMQDAIATMSTTAEDSNISVVELPSVYPQGGEKQLIKTITGRELPPGKKAVDIGCLVLNVDTCASLYRAIIKGVPLIKRICTVSGSAVSVPKNLLVRIGTPFYEMFEHCGGFSKRPYKIVAGGPMLGQAQHSLETPLIKSTNALLAFRGEEENFSDHPSCIRCGRCIKACPMNLMPNYLYMYSIAGEFEKCRQLNVEDCIECGCCSYECPGKLYLVQAMRMAKGHL